MEKSDIWSVSPTGNIWQNYSVIVLQTKMLILIPSMQFFQNPLVLLVLIICVCLCLVLYHFTTCAGLCNHQYSQDAEQSR